MIYYVIIFILLLLYVLDEITKYLKKDRVVVFSSAVVIITAFIGLRGNIEPDYAHYLNIYNRAGQELARNEFQVEPGYQFINNVFSYLKLGLQPLLLLMAAATTFLKLKFFREVSPAYLISFLLYYCSLFFLYDFIAIRQALAMTIFMIALPAVWERKLLKFVGLVVLGSLFHVSILVVLPVYFILNKQFNKFFILGILVVCLLVNISETSVPLLSFLRNFLPMPSATEAKLQVYSLEGQFAFVSVRLLIYAFLFLLFKFFADNKRYNFFFNLFIIGIIFSTIFNEIPQFAYRVKAYFLWADVILWILLVEGLFKKKLVPKVFSYCVLVGVYLFTMVDFLQAVSERGNYIYPYLFFWETR